MDYVNENKQEIQLTWIIQLDDNRTKILMTNDLIVRMFAFP